MHALGLNFAETHPCKAKHPGGEGKEEFKGAQCEREEWHKGPHWVTVWEDLNWEGEKYPSYPEEWE